MYERTLNLTPSQKQNLKDLNQKYQSQMPQIMQAEQSAFEELQLLINSDTATNEQILSKHHQLQDISRQIDAATFEHKLAARNILTPEQRKQRAAIFNDRAKITEIFRQI